MNAVRNQEKIILSEPYLAQDLSVAYITFSKFIQLTDRNLDGVAAVDINISWNVYREIMEDMGILSHTYVVDMKGNTV